LFPNLDQVPNDVNQSLGPNYAFNDVDKLKTNEIQVDIDIHDFTKLLALYSFSTYIHAIYL
jgi:hypothetical protein